MTCIKILYPLIKQLNGPTFIFCIATNQTAILKNVRFSKVKQDCWMYFQHENMKSQKAE